MIENEFKIMLTSKQYERLLAMYEWDKTVVQTNHYYDAEDMLLSEMHITCRVREIDGKHLLQMKFPGAAEFSREELEKPLNALPETLRADELLNPRGQTLPDVKRLGALTTTRSVKRFDGAELDLDKSEYFNKTDFELEIEFTDETAARRLLAEITETLNIKPNSEVCTGKIRRFLEEYGRQPFSL